MPLNPQPHLLSQAQPQTQSGSHVLGHFQLSEPQAQALAHSQFVTAHVQAQAHTAHAKFQAQLQSQAHPLAQLHSGNANNASVSSPGTGSAKRANQKPPSRLPSSSNANTSSPFKTMGLTLAAQRKKQKLPDKRIPAKIASLLPESALYTQLLELEDRVDAALARQKIDIQESFKISPHFQKTPRIYVLNTFVNQMQSTPGNKNADPPTWSLRIVGRLLEDGKDPAVSGMTLKWSTKFSSFFKITIHLDQNLYPDNHMILLESSCSPVLHDCFEVKRKGDKEFSAMIRLEINYVPEKFKLSQALSEVLGIEAETRTRVIAAIWHYVKVRKLQIPSEPTSFMCDPPLQKVFWRREDEIHHGFTQVSAAAFKSNTAYTFRA